MPSYPHALERRHCQLSSQFSGRHARPASSHPHHRHRILLVDTLELPAGHGYGRFLASMQESRRRQDAENIRELSGAEEVQPFFEEGVRSSG